MTTIAYPLQAGAEGEDDDDDDCITPVKPQEGQQEDNKKDSKDSNNNNNGDDTTTIAYPAAADGIPHRHPENPNAERETLKAIEYHRPFKLVLPSAARGRAGSAGQRTTITRATVSIAQPLQASAVGARAATTKGDDVDNDDFMTPSKLPPTPAACGHGQG
ncbi:hypothetical protein K505DRAFT_369319 [Melanomma pulvis-pyrius CBS 109.77]|uniref:Uncharacterized protein n=1 Tax=Melanomma pulvis-pyrius CBS 109.77 TaxID=1314802 RepID=A0A6A6WNN0_9PLEO|nr:hypothetical protein K505DRAFT_369319 [Melanomma pulvis-pyrius CBS 109.77]